MSRLAAPLLLLIAVICCASVCSGSVVTAGHTAATPTPPSEKIPAIVAADIGASSGSPELMFIERNFTAERTVVLPTCLRVTVGRLALAGRTEPLRVILAYSGIGAVTAGLCVQALVAVLPIDFILWPGTSGMSSSIGGAFAAPMPAGSCTLNPSATLLSLGSTCVTSATANTMCGICNGMQTSTYPIADECSTKRCFAQSKAATVGTCNFAGNTSVADRVAATMATFVPPAVPGQLQTMMASWWAANLKDAAEPNPVLPTKPTVFTQCATTTSSNLIDPSLPFDAWCRDITAALVPGKAAAEVPCVADMEDTGVAQALIEAAPEVPVAFIRGASNYDQSPLVKVPLAGYGSYWAQNFSWAPEAALAAMNAAGYEYAVHVTNEIVLHFLATL